MIVSGSGTGELIVGDRVVPLLGPGGGIMPVNEGGDGEPPQVAPSNTLLVAVGKGVRHSFWFRKPEGLRIALESDDLMIGDLPTIPIKWGWIAFPHTEATVPCIHDFDANAVRVSLVHGKEFQGLTATWSDDSEDVFVENRPPASADVYGYFSRRETRSISYRVTHPDKLNQTDFDFVQELRFCPQLTEEEESWLGSGGSEDDGNWGAPVEPDGSLVVEDGTPEAESASLYTNILANASWAGGVLYLHGSGSPVTDTVPLSVPAGAPHRCCPCPEHWASNYVALAQNSRRLFVRGQDGEDFSLSYEPCSAAVTPCRPSAEIGDARIGFVTNGVAYKSRSYTVLGVNIDNPSNPLGVPLERYNELSPDFGFPFVVRTNLDYNASLTLTADVLLTNGVDDERALYDFWNGTNLYNAAFPSLEQSERPLADAVAARCLSSRGVALLEARSECVDPVEIVVKVDGQEMLVYCPELSFCDIRKFYWWHNLRHSFGSDGQIDPDDTNALVTAQLPAETFAQDADLFFVHGYNMAQHEAREWAQATYKRLWWAGFRGRFHAVTWYSNDSQFRIPGQGYVCPNYHVNVEHAFASASNLAEVVRGTVGPRYILAHSLGNMLVSAAIQDWQMPYDKYFMLNAAVPIEAYMSATNAVDTAMSARMTPEAWAGMDLRLTAANWHAFFDEDDGRRKLTWRGRFADVTNAVNYYSPEEEVLKCGNGEHRSTLQRDYAWYNQERMKGVKPFEIGIGRNEGGWGFNRNYMIQDEELDPDYGTRVYYRRRTPVEALPLLSDPTVDFRLVPFFGWFEDRTICTNAFLAEGAISRELQSQLLADAIPALSLPAGFSPIPPRGNNESVKNSNMATTCYKDQTTKEILFPGEDNGKWKHSFFLSVPYMVVHRLFEEIVETTSGDNQQGGSQ